MERLKNYANHIEISDCRCRIWFIYKYDKHVYKNKYGGTEEVYECESCDGCPPAVSTFINIIISKAEPT